jgi:hypothetical protein
MEPARTQRANADDGNPAGVSCFRQAGVGAKPFSPLYSFKNNIQNKKTIWHEFCIFHNRP